MPRRLNLILNTMSGEFISNSLKMAIIAVAYSKGTEALVLQLLVSERPSLLDFKHKALYHTINRSRNNKAQYWVF